MKFPVLNRNFFSKCSNFQYKNAIISSIKRFNTTTNMSASISTSTSTSSSTSTALSGMNEHNFSHRPIEELFPLIASLIDTKNLLQVDQLVNFCRNKRPQDWLRALNTASIPNMLFKIALDNYPQALSAADLRTRFQILRKDLNMEGRRSGINSVCPDSMTFALMFKYVLMAGEIEKMGDNSIKSDLKFLEAESVLYNFNPKIILDCLQNSELLSEEQWKYLNVLLEYQHANDNNTTSEVVTAVTDTNTNTVTDDLLLPKYKLENLDVKGDDLPEVRTISSKSEGINFIKNSLRQLYEINPESLNNPSIMHNLQIRLEQDCYTAMIAKLQKEANALAQVSGTGNISNIKRELFEWHEKLKSVLQAEFDGRSTTNSSITDSNSNPSLNPTPVQVKNQDFGYYLAMLSVLDAEKISIIVIQELLKLSHYEPFFLTVDNASIPIKAARLVTIATNIGAALQREVFAAQISKKPFLNRAQLNPLQLSQIFDKKRTLDKSMRRVYAKLEDDLEAQREGWVPAWSNGLKAEIGSFLLSLVEKSLTFKCQDGRIEAPFKHSVIYAGNSRKLGVIRISDEVFERLKSDRHLSYVEAWAMPMLVPPRPWLTITSGGYLTHKNTCVRLKDDPIHLSLLTSSQKEGFLESILMGLDVLGSVPWRINDSMLKVAIELWNQGVNVSEMSQSPSVAVSPEDSTEATHNSNFPFMKREDFEKVEEYREYCRQAVNFRNEQSRIHSMTCDTNYKLEIARTFSGVSFYLPHSVDFRGRAYPIPPHLSHIGSDLSRGLLQFAEGKPLGPRGLFWLKVQFSNMCGNDKCSLEDRAAFADRHLDQIHSSARNPLASDAFWRTADEPWQCLATCKEISEALSQPNPYAFISRLPIQQDGSCNGSQHYAALGGDVEGATQVNLAPSPLPQDIYGTVAKIVSREIDREVEAFSAVANGEKSSAADGSSASVEVDLTEKVARLLKGRITRKIVKQPVMTNIYGVTLYGAKKQIEARLKEFSLIPAEDEPLMRRAREYLTHKVFGALDELFVKARQIQNWLEYCATEICRSVPLPVAERYGYGESVESVISEADVEIDHLRKLNASTWNPCKEYGQKHDLELTDRYPQTPVSWTTPLAFRVLQPYLKSSSVQLKTVLQLCSLQQSTIFDAVDASKQIAAFPPNFIHSLDATHMFRTALACYRENITFASVHDCFWTHGASVDDMNRVLREEFVAMHSEPILERLRTEFLQIYRDYKVPVVLKKKGSSGGKRVWRDIFIPPLPERGSFDLKQVLESKYFFS